MRTIPQDELNQLPSRYDYKPTDKTIRYLTLLIIRKFRDAKSIILTANEREIAKYSRKMYRDLLDHVERSYLKLARHQYESAGGHRKTIDRDWLIDILGGYDPVMKRVFLHEADRKASVFVEAVISAVDKAAEVDIRMREWSRFVNQGALNVTDYAVMQAFEEEDEDDDDVYVWITARDERVCEECAPRHGKTYLKKELPVKHPNCRCIIQPVEVD